MEQETQSQQPIQDEQASIQQPSPSEIVSPSGEIKEEPKETVKEELKGGEKPDQKKPTPLLSKIFGEEQKVAIPEDYTINFPEGMPEDQIQSAKEMFVKNGLSKDDAQLLTNSMVQSLQQYEARQREEHDKRVDQDIKRLREEFGSDEFSRLDANARRFVKESDLPKETLEAFITHVGALLQIISHGNYLRSFLVQPEMHLMLRLLGVQKNPHKNTIRNLMIRLYMKRFKREIRKQ